MQELFSFSYDASVPFHIFQYSPSTKLVGQHWHSFYEIGYCYEGKGTFFIGDRSVSVGPGDLFLFPPYEPHIAQSAGDIACRFFFIYFGLELFPAEDRQLFLPFRQTIFHIEEELTDDTLHAVTLHEIFHSMFEEYETRKSGYTSMLRSRMLDLVVRLFRLEERLYSETNWQGMLTGLNQLKPALQLLEQRYAEPIGLADLAKVLSLSESRARHLFKSGVGKGFKEYLAYVRIQHAKRLLYQTDLSVSEVYAACGYQSAAPFYRTFQQLVGVSPLGFRNRRLGNSRF